MNAAPARPDGILVDVGIPTHRRPAYLVQAVESVFQQTMPSWTLTVSENGAGSEYVAGILEPFLRDPRVHYVATGSDLGGARNSSRLIQHGSAPYVALLHDDDLWDPEFLARRVGFLDANPTCGLVFSSCDFVDARGDLVHHFTVDLPGGVQDRAAFLRMLYGWNMVGISTPLVRRACYEAVGPTFNDFVLFYDHEMWLRIAASFDVGFLPVADAKWRVHRSQTTQDAQWHWGEHRLRLLDEAEKILPADFPQLEKRRARWVALVRGSLDARRRGERRVAAAYLWRAMRLHPTSAVDPAILSRVLAWLRQRDSRHDLSQAGLVDS